MTEQPQETLHFLLGGMASDIKTLVAASEKQAGRMSKLEDRTTKLEGFATRIGVLTASLGIGVPTLLTVILRKMGLL